MVSRNSCVFAFSGLFAFGVLTAQAASTDLRIPSHFEKNNGQWSADVKYLASLGQYRVTLTTAGVTVPVSADRSLRISFPGGAATPATEGREPLKATSNYFVGARQRWRSGVPQYRRVRYSEVYPGVDVDYYTTADQLEFDFVLRGGADPNRIRLRFTGADKLSVSQEGDLVVEAGGRQLRQLRPTVYQEIEENGNRVRRAIEGRYLLASNNEVRFALGAYDRSRTLVIDPVLVYSSYLGGTRVDTPVGIAVDSQGKAWVAGNTASTDLPVRGNPYRESKSENLDVFVARFNPTARGEDSLEMVTYLGGAFSDEVTAITISASGWIGITGTTGSFDFPVIGYFPYETNKGMKDVFVAMLSPTETGSAQLAYSTYLGGTDNEVANAIAFDANDSICVTGYTLSSDFALTANPLQPIRRGGYDLFITKLDPSRPPAEGLRYSTYLGTTTTEVGTGIATDSAGMIYVAGYTMAPDFPLAGVPYRETAPGRGDGFIVKLNPDLGFPDSLVYGTFFGGSGLDRITGLRIDRTGAAVVTGYTDSDDLPLSAGAFQYNCGGSVDAFVARLDLSRPGPQALLYSSYFGGAGTDIAYGLAIDGSNRVVLAGYTTSADLPLKGQVLPERSIGDVDFFVAWIDTAALGESSLLSSGVIGGTQTDVAVGVAADSRGRAYITGFTVSRNIPATSGAYAHSLYEMQDSFISVIDF